MLIDTHAHLDDAKFDRDRDEVVARLHEHGIGWVINVGCDLPSSEQAVAMAKRYPNLFAAVGVHPHDAKSLDSQTYQRLRTLAREAKVVAIGEIGLDYYYDYSPREVQQRVFREQIALAKECGLPVVIHDRDAHQDLLNILKAEKAAEAGGVLHCFSGSWEMAKICLGMGFYISIAGPVTFHNAVKVQEVVRLTPLDRLLVETDCPYLTPQPHRGKRNEPAYVRYVAQKIAEIKGLPFETVASATTENACRLFSLQLSGNHAEPKT